jgi:hypothetical protein
MDRNDIETHRFIAVLITCAAVLSLIGPALAKSGDPAKKKPAVAKKAAKLDPDRAAVAEFFKTVKAATERQAKLTPESGHGYERGTYHLPETWCAERLKVPKEAVIDRCLVRELAERRVAVLIMVSNCEAERCDAGYWIFSDRKGLRRSPATLDYELVVSPDYRFLYVGQIDMGRDGYTTRLTRIELKTLETREVAGCASPALSPSKRWIVCRDAVGDVHRFSTPQGPLERVHTVDLGEERIYSDGHGSLGVSAVQFIRKNRMRVVTLTSDGEEDMEVVQWKE